jgi:hypothetical protein
MERMRRLRMGLAHSSSGASGDTARPNYVGPSGNGLVERMKAGESPSNQGRTVWAPLSVSRRRSRGLRKNAAVERREARRSALWTGSSLPLEGPALPQGGPRGAAFRTCAFRRSAPSRCEGASPRQRGDGNAGAPRAFARTGAAELCFF